MLEGEEGVSGGQAVRALMLRRAQAGQEAVHEEQALVRVTLRMLRMQPHRVQRYREPPLRIWPALHKPRFLVMSRILVSCKFSTCSRLQWLAKS